MSPSLLIKLRKLQHFASNDAPMTIKAHKSMIIIELNILAGLYLR